jgi:hypothetical protein
VEFSSIEKRVVTRRCHDNYRGNNFNEINLIKLFCDRMKMRKKLLQRQQGQGQQEHELQQQEDNSMNEFSEDGWTAAAADVAEREEGEEEVSVL